MIQIIRFPMLLLAVWVGLVSCLGAEDFPQIYNSEPEEHGEPMPAEEAARKMKLPQGFSVQVFAAEPEVQNPIAMAWDQRGRLWVAENYTYAEREQRFDLSLRDRVLIFTDEDHDGTPEKRQVFTENVQMLTSVEVGRGGVWLMCPPQLLFIPDANGDDVPDGPAEVVLDGFTIGKGSYHNFANGLRWGPDGWLYGRCGHSCPGRIGVPGTPNELRVPIEGGIWRYHPERKIVEVLCHGTVNPWGHDWDQNGELFFINTVIGHLWHAMPGAHFIESFGESLNPHVYKRLDMIADHYHYDRSGSWAASRGGSANKYGGGHAHIGMMIYQGQQWPQKYRNKLFTLNMHGRRANVERLERYGAGYIGRHEPDFLIAEDPFFRGMEISVAPDGNVFVLDWSDTGECHEHTGVHRSSGRIFKISYGESGQPQRFSKPLCLSGEGKLPQLWQEYQAGKTTPESLRKLLDDPNEHVRVWAIRLLTDFWPLDTIVGPRKDAVYPDDPQTYAELLRLAREDESGRVLLALASTLQRLPVSKRAKLATELVQHEKYAQDRDLPSMVWFGLIPVGKQHPEALVEVAKNCRFPRTLRWIARNLALQIESKPEPMNQLFLLSLDFPKELQESVLEGASEAFKGWRSAPEPGSWDEFTKSEAAQAKPELVRELNLLFGSGRAMEEIREIALNPKAELKLRQTALKTLIEARPEDLRQICESLLKVRSLNATAAQGLALFDDAEIAEKLAKSYRRFHPDDRPAVLETLVSRPKFALALLENVGEKRGQIPPSEISAFHARQMHSLKNAAITEKLKEVWGELRDSPAEKRAAIAKFRQQLSQPVQREADLSAGRLLFRKTCSQCHKLYGSGENVGPDLTGSQRANLDYLLENILDPSAVVGKDYRMKVLILVDGRVMNGLIVSENDKVLVLQTATERKTINRDDVDEIVQTSKSPMPDGLLNNLTPEQIQDLISYLRHPSQVPLPKESAASE